MAKTVTPEKAAKKAKRKHRAKVILCVIFSIYFVFKAVTGILTATGLKSNISKAKSFPAVNTELKFENISNGVWNIYSDKELKIIQLTDVHIGGGWMSKGKDLEAMNAVASMLAEERPDFVIVTGDISYPVFFQAGTFNNKNGAKEFASLMETLGIYWTLSYGNHDTEAYSFYSREDLTDFYSGEEFPHCLMQGGPEEVDGSGNQIFNIVNSDGIITRTIFVLDSHSYVDGDIFGILWKYDNIHDNQIEWYSNTVKSLPIANKKAVAALDPETASKYTSLTENVPTSVFMHIPMTEYDDAWHEYYDNGYKDTENVKYIFGDLGEKHRKVFCGIHEDNFFETMLELGSTDYVFCGHDHLNVGAVNYKGINLVYGMSIDYLAYIGIYKLGTQRGCTVISISADGDLNLHTENYYQNKYVPVYEKETVEMQELDVGSYD